MSKKISFSLDGATSVLSEKTPIPKADTSIDVGAFKIYPEELNTSPADKSTTFIYNKNGEAFPYGAIPLLPTQKLDRGILIDFNKGARVCIPKDGKAYRVRFIAKDLHLCVFDAEVPSGMCASSNKFYFINYLIEVYDKGATKPFISYHMDLTDKLVLIQCHGGGIGDSIGWFSYIERFVNQHKCRALVTMNENIIPIFEKQYPNIKFIKKEDTVKYKPLATYYMGLFFQGDRDFQYTDFRVNGLHKISASILNVDDKEEPPRVDLSAPRQIKEKYAVISTQSTTRCKYWNNPYGWISVIKFLKSNGYRVICIDKDIINIRQSGNIQIPFGCEDFTGDLPLQERINIIKDADFFIGLSSGMSWLAWCCKVPVVLISGFTEPFNEFYTPYRIFNPLVCHGCWNDMRENFDHYDFDYCPKLKGTSDQFICTKSISAEYVISVIRGLPSFRGTND